MNNNFIPNGIFIGALLTLSVGAIAAENAQPRISKTIVTNSSSLVTQSGPEKSVSSIVHEPLVATGPRARANVTATQRTLNSTVYFFDAASETLADLDGDGFAHRFKLSFDADTLRGISSTVYADVFLSFEGGPWNYFHTTEPFTLYGVRNDDRVVMVSDLEDGYPAGFYDVLIELYAAGTDEFLADYGPYDSYSLAALPLEDQYSDNYYDASPRGYTSDVYVETYAGGGGSADYILVFLVCIAAALRGVKPRYRKTNNVCAETVAAYGRSSLRRVA